MALTKTQCQDLGWHFEIDNGTHCSAEWVPTDGSPFRGPVIRGPNGSNAQAAVLAKITSWNSTRGKFKAGHLRAT